MKKFLLNDVTEAFLYVTTTLGIVISLLLAMMEAPDSVCTPVGVITLMLIVMSIYYGTWRGIMRDKGL